MSLKGPKNSQTAQNQKATAPGKTLVKPPASASMGGVAQEALAEFTPNLQGAAKSAAIPPPSQTAVKSYGDDEPFVPDWDACAEHRSKDFAIEASPILNPKIEGLFKVEYTDNVFQHYALDMTPTEARKFIEALEPFAAPSRVEMPVTLDERTNILRSRDEREWPIQDLRDHFLGQVASTGNLGQRLDKNGNNLERFLNAIMECEEAVRAVNQIATLDPERATLHDAIKIATESTDG